MCLLWFLHPVFLINWTTLLLLNTMQDLPSSDEVPSKKDIQIHMHSTSRARNDLVSIMEQK
jgi:hypothetical protein